MLYYENLDKTLCVLITNILCTDNMSDDYTIIFSVNDSKPFTRDLQWDEGLSYFMWNNIRFDLHDFMEV